MFGCCGKQRTRSKYTTIEARTHCARPGGSRGSTCLQTVCTRIRRVPVSARRLRWRTLQQAGIIIHLYIARLHPPRSPATAVTTWPLQHPAQQRTIAIDQQSHRAGTFNEVPQLCPIAQRVRPQPHSPSSAAPYMSSRRHASSPPYRLRLDV
ncbi:hypothetical protein K466DRAFT_96628 [Polyporus arcularius HHB13444]|uniref:Uncharacterized protein n=1 Tax=Polyporus arcularius HHB13444 TaxID=1314778 RepID=A0A5C3PEY1_9APHY|nr:hypothetical protein K466DRAFT_96628 [Polyporus arcularius HHB13444]